MAKSAVEILVRCFVDGKTSDLYHYQSYLIVFAFCFAVSQLFHESRFATVLNCSIIPFGVLCIQRHIHFELFDLFPANTKYVAYPGNNGGIRNSFILLGVLGLSWHLGWHDDLAFGAV